MGLIDKIRQIGGSATRRSLRYDGKSAAWRTCRFELMEPRQLLSVDVLPIQLGVVYHEDATGEDLGGGDRFQITFSGGAAGTQMTELVINTDKEINGLSMGDCLFDIDASQQGAFGYVPFSDVDSGGVQLYSVTVEDGGTLLTLRFEGFEAGDTFSFSIDVDEMGFSVPNAMAEGNEFEGSILTATFTADHFETAVGSSIFRDEYNTQLAASGLNLPSDDYTTPPAEAEPVQTAAAFIELEQKPLPITISGTVFEDNDTDLVQDAGVDAGIAGVTLSLYKLLDGQYVDTGRTTQTGQNGDYSFDAVLPGTYRVVETQPSGYLDVGAVAGTVGGATRGSTSGDNIITEVELLGGEDSIENNFAEVRPASISGHVYHDANNNGVRDTGETPISGVTIFLEQTGSGGSGGGGLITFGVQTTTTDANGFWSFDNLMPGEIFGRRGAAGRLSRRARRGRNRGRNGLQPGRFYRRHTTCRRPVGAKITILVSCCPPKFPDTSTKTITTTGCASRASPPIANVVITLLDEAGNSTGRTGRYRYQRLLRIRRPAARRIRPGGKRAGRISRRAGYGRKRRRNGP